MSNCHSTNSQKTGREGNQGIFSFGYFMFCLVWCGLVWFFNQEPIQAFPQGRVEILLKGERMDTQ